MKLRTVLACVASVSSFALLGSFLAPGSTYALWGDEAEAPAVTVQPAHVSATTSRVVDSSKPALLTLPSNQPSQDLSMWRDAGTNLWSKSTPTTIVNGGSPGNPPDDYLNYSYVGSQFTWNAAAASALIIQQMQADPHRSWFGVSAVAQLSATSYGPLSWGVLVQWTPKQTANKATVWDKSATGMFTVGSADDCVISDARASALLAQENKAAYKDTFIPGPRFSPDMGESQDVFVCVVQVYQPIRHSDQAVATAPGTSAGSTSGKDITSAPDTWSALVYDLIPFDAAAGLSPVLGLNITPIDPLHGPARDS